ncbi:hypothetical protein EHS25_007762 [Saitozyma podzolica]|uniref:Alpha/beta hydrolase fold-3 domain-containing protein n=1 Tax=Saitozyma podzolica TaxID=1890683 RepID=A0A427YQU7_9TREE|nr:hypothetical protein EHS25_007762 [Saitozyma podzolica]
MGGFVAGKHVIPNAWVVPAFQQYGYHVISIAYRFIPHVGLADIVDDCIDALAWCRANLPSLLGEDTIDLDRYVVAGDSAGGTLSTICGFKFEPKPKAVIDVFGVVDLMDPHFYTPQSVEAAAMWGKYHRARDDTELAGICEERDPSKAEVICPWDWELPPNMSTEDLRVFWGTPDFTPGEKDLLRMDLMKYTGKMANKFNILLRKEELSPEQFDQKRKEWSPFWVVDERKTYPPTFFLHGTADSAVPVEQSYRFAEKLKRLGVPTGEAYCPDGEHCFENKIERPEDEGWNEYIVPCMEFVDQHVRG